MTMVVAKGQWGPNAEVWIDAIGKDGKRYSDSGDRSVSVVHTSTPSVNGLSENLRVPAGDVDHYVLRYRLRECATFEGFAAEPKIVPPEIGVE
jgi:hypothetical protein